MSVFHRYLSLILALAAGPGASAAGRPNIVFILADDLGYTDVNVFASHITGDPTNKMFYETPNIDRLAAGGLSFSQDALYWGDPIKTPQALLNGSTLLALPAGHERDDGQDAFTFAEALPEYRSAFVGKWHLGGHGAEGYQPKDQGFEEIAFHDAGGSAFRNWRNLWDRNARIYPEMPQKELRWGKSGGETGEVYLTDDLSVQADRFIRSHHKERPGQPFLLYYCEFAVHSPYQAKPGYVDHFAKKPTRGWNGHRDPVYAAMIRSLDDSVGRLMATLDELKLTENTLVVFMSDNGGIGYVKSADDTAVTNNAPLKGGKAMMHEGGVRVPLVFRWPAKISAGGWCDVPVAASDLFPTFVQAGGLDPEAMREKHSLEGHSLMPLFKDPKNGNKHYKRDTFIWHYPFNVVPLNPDDGYPLTPHSAIRKGDHKLIFDWSGRLKLHDIRKDISERHDLAGSMPDLTRSLFRELNDWLDAHVETKYMPALNPNYDPESDPRSYPFVDLRRKLLGPDRAIRSIAGDARLEKLTGP